MASPPPRSPTATTPDSLLIEASSTPDPTLGPSATLALQRNPQHGLLDGTHAGLVSDTWTWNAYAEPTDYVATINGNPILMFAYDRDALGRITQNTETLQGIDTVTSYTYDLAGRLETVTINGQPSESYTYDANGNRLTVTPGQGAPTVATYDAQDRLLTHGPCTYTHTPNGELATRTCGDQTTRYTYNLFGDLTAVEQPDGTMIEYIVDGRGRRVGKRIDGDLVQGFLYLNQLEPVAELDGDGNIIATFVYADRSHVPSLMHKAGKTYRIITDHLGSPRLVIDTTTGEIAQRLDYDAWGNVTEDTNPGFQPFGFAGGIHDRDTGFVRFGARDYNSRPARWTTKDPIRFFGGDTNIFNYVGSEPINWIDPLGLSKFDQWWGLPKKFRNWYHRKYKSPGDKDIPDRETAEEIFREWDNLGRPGPDNKRGGRKYEEGFFDPEMALDLLGVPGMLLSPTSLGCADFDCNPRDGEDDRWANQKICPL